MHLFFRPDYKSFRYLNATQFLGALNDNIFKLLLVFLIINLKGTAAASTILAKTGAIFVIPFLLFSSAAGVLADRLSKREILVNMKIAEIVIMAFSFLAVYFKSETSLYVLLFFMAAQSAVFGPSKYGIIPEIVESQKVSKANGLLTSLTYVAIILGTFLASFLTDITHKNFLFSSGVCLFIAILGYITSLGIAKTAPKASKKKINPLFVYEIYKTLAQSAKIPHLIWAILGSSYFLFIGGFAQLNTIPFALQSLNLSEVAGGYLFLMTAIGIAIGSIIAGKLSKDRVEPGISCIAGFFLAFLLLLLGIFSRFLIPVVILLVLLGVFGGMFLIPFDSFIQVMSPDKKRGQIIAASNFLSFSCVLLASLFLYIFSGKLGFSSASGFTLIGGITFIFTLFITGRTSDIFFPYFANKILLRFCSLEIKKTLPNAPALLIMQDRSLLSAFLLYSLFPSLKLFISATKLKDFPFFNGLFNTFYISSKRTNLKNALFKIFTQAHKIKRRATTLCFILDKSFSKQEIDASIKTIFKDSPLPVFYIKTEKVSLLDTFLGIKYHVKKTTFSFLKAFEEVEN